MAKLDVNTGAALIAVSTFQLWGAWNQNAPSLSDLRAASPGDATHQRLQDAAFQVGGLVAVIGLAFGALTGEWRAALVMGAVFAGLVFWSYQVMDAPHGPDERSA